MNFALISLGMSLQGIIVYELMCLVDYIEKEDSVKKLGVVGFQVEALVDYGLEF